MTGRGVDQILPNPSDPVIHERWVKDAREYVKLAERRSGPIPRPVRPEYIWGEALTVLEQADPALRIVNLETAVTSSNRAWPGKGINYRMHPDNVACLTAAGIECCVLANNHVLDWGFEGLLETLETLHSAGIQTAGAGADLTQARQPMVADLGTQARVLVFAAGSPTAGVVPEWAAEHERAGVWVVDERSRGAPAEVAEVIAPHRRPGDVVVLSVHWGPNWGYKIPSAQRSFARAVIERSGVDIVYGHSSHHVKGLEIFNGSLILYGCGDLLNDYEGIEGYEQFRDDLGLMYCSVFEAGTSDLSRIDMYPTRLHRMRVERASSSEVGWLADVLRNHSHLGDAGIRVAEDNRLEIAILEP